MESMERIDLSEVWKEWKIIEKLGEGSFGRVYRAVREERGTAFYSAIKVITIPQSESEISSMMSDGMDKESTRSYYQGIVDDCINEIEMMESLKGTTNIVSVDDYKVVQHKDKICWDIYIRMELLTGLNEYAAGKTLAEGEVIRLGMDICKALEYCEKLNIIHRDVKPENIFITKFNEFKLGDFGIARKLEKTKESLSRKGTYNYMAPEVYHGRDYGADIDTYSLGILLYKLMNHNRLPFLNLDKPNITSQERETALIRRFRGDSIPAPSNASPEFARIILKACSFQPADRYTSARQMGEELFELLTGNRKKGQENWENENDHTVAVRAPMPSNNTKVKKKTPLIVVGIVGVVLAAALGIFAVKALSQRNGNSKAETANTSEIQEDVVKENSKEDAIKKDTNKEDTNKENSKEDTTKDNSKEDGLSGEGSGDTAKDGGNNTAPNNGGTANAAASSVSEVDGDVQDTTVYYADVYDFLSLRKSANTKAEVLAYLPPFTAMYVLEREGGMAKVRVLENGGEGFVNEEYITSDMSACVRAGKTADESNDTTGIQAGYSYQANVKEFLTLRDAPKTSGKELKKLPDGTWMEVLEVTNSDFCKIKVEETGEVGYVMSSYLY